MAIDEVGTVAAGDVVTPGAAVVGDGRKVVVGRGGINHGRSRNVARVTENDIPVVATQNRVIIGLCAERLTSDVNHCRVERLAGDVPQDQVEGKRIAAQRQAVGVYDLDVNGLGCLTDLEPQQFRHMFIIDRRHGGHLLGVNDYSPHIERAPPVYCDGENAALDRFGDTVGRVVEDEASGAGQVGDA